MKSIAIDIYNEVTDSFVTFIDTGELERLRPSAKTEDDAVTKKWLFANRYYLITENSIIEGLFDLPPYTNNALAGSAEDGSEFFSQYYGDRTITFTFLADKITQLVDGSFQDSYLRINETIEQWDELLLMTIFIDTGTDTERVFSTKVAKSENTSVSGGVMEFTEFNHGIFYYSPLEFQNLTGSTGAEIQIYSKYDNMPLYIDVGECSQFGIKNISNKQEVFVQDLDAYGFTRYILNSFNDTAVGFSPEDGEYIDLISTGNIFGTLLTLKRGWNTLQITNRDTPITISIATRKAVRMCF